MQQNLMDGQRGGGSSDSPPPPPGYTGLLLFRNVLGENPRPPPPPNGWSSAYLSTLGNVRSGDFFWRSETDIGSPYASLSRQSCSISAEATAKCNGRVQWVVDWLSGGFTPCRHLRPSSGREHTMVTYSVR